LRTLIFSRRHRTRLVFRQYGQKADERCRPLRGRSGLGENFVNCPQSGSRSPKKKKKKGKSTLRPRRPSSFEGGESSRMVGPTASLELGSTNRDGWTWVSQSDSATFELLSHCQRVCPPSGHWVCRCSPPLREHFSSPRRDELIELCRGWLAGPFSSLVPVSTRSKIPNYMRRWIILAHQIGRKQPRA